MVYGLEVNLEEVEKNIILRLNGRIDAASSAILEKKINRLVEDNHIVLLLDFAMVEYLSSAGMRLLLSTTKNLAAKEGRLIIFNITDDVFEVIKMAGFERILNICKTEQEALQFIPKKK